MRILDNSIVKPLARGGNEYNYSYQDLEIFCMRRGDICESPKYMYGAKKACERWVEQNRALANNALWLYKDLSPQDEESDDETWGVRPKQGPLENEWGEIGA